MPQNLSVRLQAVETAASNHIAECAVRTASQAIINADQEQRIRDLERARWKFVGTIGAVCTIASMVGSALLSKLLGG